MAKRKRLTFDSDTLADDLKESAGKGVDALFSPAPAPAQAVDDLNNRQAIEPPASRLAHDKPRRKKTRRTQPSMQPRNRDTKQPRNHATTVSRYHATTIEFVRKAVKELGKEAATHRFTLEEKKSLVDLIYAYKNRGLQTSENEITRIAVNFILHDYRENGQNSILDKVLKALSK